MSPGQGCDRPPGPSQSAMGGEGAAASDLTGRGPPCGAPQWSEAPNVVAPHAPGRSEVDAIRPTSPGAPPDPRSECGAPGSVGVGRGR